MRSDDATELRSVLELLRRALLDVRFARLELKYRPDQPRAPAGSPEGGQWTDGEGGEGGLQLIADRRAPRGPADLKREENEGGHTLARHVSRSNADLMRTLSAEQLDTPAETVFWDREGSFNDLQSAEHYTNDVLDSYPAEVNSVASGKEGDAFLEKRYDSPTGAKHSACGECQRVQCSDFLSQERRMICCHRSMHS